MPSFAEWGTPVPLLLLALVCGLATALAIPAMMPVLRRYALARPNARSSHTAPTPQGGGLPLTGAWVIALLVVCVLSPGMAGQERLSLAVLAGGAALLAALGCIDDIRPLPALPRLAVQLGTAGAVVWTLPDTAPILAGLLPPGLERVVLMLGLVWFVNLTNFMDGIDWITVAGFLPLAGALLLLGAVGAASPAVGITGALLLGGLAGFAPYNKPVARLFLGDVGSLPIGLVAGYALIRLAQEGHLAAALILPLYALADATVTLLRRLRAGERVWDAHRSHFYQRAIRNGYSVTEVVTRVAMLDLVLAGTASLLVLAATPPRIAFGLAAAGAGVTSLLVAFNRRRAP